MHRTHIDFAATGAALVAGIFWLGFAAAAIAWLATVGADPAVRLPLVIAILTLFVAAIVATFSLRYMRADRRSVRFFLTLGAVVAAVLAFVATSNVIVLAVAWGVSGWLLASLIAHSAGWHEAAAAAQRARITFLSGDAALLAALALLGWQAGSVDLNILIARTVDLPTLVTAAAAILLVLAAAARCALPPFSDWLLSSMTAPTPVSALMHAGMVNAGGFLLIRFAPVLEAAPTARMVAVALGLCGAVYGLGIMLVRPDVKRSLAGSTISQMGFMIISCGLGAYAAALWHLVAHGLFKAWLFLGSGSNIGMRDRPWPASLTGLPSLYVATITGVAAYLVLALGKGGPSLVPLSLAAATAAAMIVSLLADEANLRAKAAGLAAIATLVALHAGGLALIRDATGNDGPPLLPDWTLLTLLVVFLGGWVWQGRSLSKGRGLPLTIYVRLINAGRLAARNDGEKQ